MAQTPLPPILGEMAGFLLAKAHNLFHERANAVIDDERLTIKHFGCLTVIADEGRISQQYLGERIRVDRTTIVAIVDDLEREGFVERHRNPDDRRAYALEAKPAGRRWLDSTRDELMAAQDELLSALTPGEREQLVEMLQRLLMSDAAELVANPAIEVRAG